MGGGLNILPHKSWNVYNVKNRRKVEEDEEKHKVELERRAKEKKESLAKERLGNLRNKEDTIKRSRFELFPEIDPKQSDRKNKIKKLKLQDEKLHKIDEQSKVREDPLTFIKKAKRNK